MSIFFPGGMPPDPPSSASHFQCSPSRLHIIYPLATPLVAVGISITQTYILVSEVSGGGGGGISIGITRNIWHVLDVLCYVLLDVMTYILTIWGYFYIMTYFDVMIYFFGIMMYLLTLLPRPRRGLRGIVFTLSVCLCVCLANILAFYFSAIGIDIDLKFIQDIYRVVLNSLKQIDIHGSKVKVTGTVHCFLNVQLYHKNWAIDKFHFCS